MLFFWLLNYLQENYNPESFTVEVWDKQRMQDWIRQNNLYLNIWILDKLEFVENSVVSKRFRQIFSILWFDKYRKYFKVFWWWEVLDESRSFPHNWRNLPILHRHSIRKWNFILVWWIGSDHKKATKYLYRYLLPKAQKIICREGESVDRVKKYIKNKSKVLLVNDFCHDILLNTLPTGQAGSQWKEYIHNNTILINIWPKYFTPENIKIIQNYLKDKSKHKKIFFPADINFDKEFYTKLRKIIPDLEIYDRTKHTLKETLDLFMSCEAGIGSRLHFLYPLKVFKKDLLSISDSDKVKKMI